MGEKLGSFKMPRKRISKKDIDLIFEIGCLRFIDRTWKQFLSPDFANLSEHTLRVIWLSLLIAKCENIKDTDKIMKMALIHDIDESRTGDAHYLSRQYIDRFSDLAVKDVLSETSFGEEFLNLWKEYDARKSIESKIVKDADNLDVRIEIREQSFRGFKFSNRWKTFGKMVRKKLYTKTAKKILDEIIKADPNKWHASGRNRYIDGDFKK